MHKLKARRKGLVTTLILLGITMVPMIDGAPMQFVLFSGGIFLSMGLYALWNEYKIYRLEMTIDRIDPSTWGEPDTGHHSGLRRR